VLSGSPVAAASLSLFNGGAINALQTFTMINGSRMGASFIVLFIGFVYMLRGHEPKRSLSMGLLSLLTTWTVYIPAMLLGTYFITQGTFDRVHMSSSAELDSFMDAIFDPIVAWITSWAPGLLVFAVGVGVILIAFNLIDHALPELKLGGTDFGEAPRLLYRPIVMFLLGSAVTIVSMSVSVSLSLLVPLSARGYVRRENVIPYIMGANITTFIDTLLGAVLLNNPPAFTIVLTEMLSIAIVSIIVLLTMYKPYVRNMLSFVGWVTERNRNLAIFMIAIFIIPLILLLI